MLHEQNASCTLLRVCNPRVAFPGLNTQEGPINFPPVLQYVACDASDNAASVNLSFACRYEGRIVQQMIMNDGGQGDYHEAALPMLGIWDTVLAVGSHPDHSPKHLRNLNICFFS